MALYVSKLNELITRTVTTYTNSRVTSIGESAFRSCTALTTVNLPQATSIGKSAFRSCTALTTVNLPQATSIGSYTFQYCSALTTLDLPKVTSIGEQPFVMCSALEKLIIRTPTVCGVAKNVLDRADKCHVYVPDDLVDKYKTNGRWAKYADRIHPISELP